MPKVENVAFMKGGFLSEFTVSIGDEVEQGDILAFLEEEGIEEQINSLINEMTNLQFNHDYDRKHQEYKIQIAALEYEEQRAVYAGLNGLAKKEKYIELVTKKNEISSMQLELTHMQ